MSEPLDPPETPEEWFQGAQVGVYRDAVFYGMGITNNGAHVPLQEVFVTKELPLYTSHKRVRALEIRSIGSYSTDAKGELRREVVFADPAFPRIDVPGNMFERYIPKPGDYYVVYEDGYASFSPRKAFLDGYSPTVPENVLMERLNDLVGEKPNGVLRSWPAKWLAVDNWAEEVARVAREAYVTINSLKQQIERLDEYLMRCQPGPYAVTLGNGTVIGLNQTSPHGVKREKADPDQSE